MVTILPGRLTARAAAADPAQAQPEPQPDRVQRMQLVLGGGAVLAVLGLGVAYRLAAQGDPARFTVYWASLVGWLAVATWVLLRRGSGRGLRSLTLVVTALVMATPKVLRTPTMPMYFDELAHWRQTDSMAGTGRIYQDNVVGILRDYPGLHVLTTALERVSGLTTWQVATVLLLALRMTVPITLAWVARSAGLSPRAADLAALVYLLNPGFMFFTGMYAYESLAIVWQLVVLGLLGRVVAGSRADAGSARRLAVLLTAALAVTHHLTSIMLIAIVLLTLASNVGRVAAGAVARREARRRVARLCLGLALVVLSWTTLNAADVWAYLSVFPAKAFEQLRGLLTGASAHAGQAAPAVSAADGAGGRSLLSGTGLPAYETISALLSVPLVCVLGLVGVLLLRRRWGSPFVRVLIVLAVAYPLSMPFVLTVHGAPGAHRSWPFAYEGLAVLVGAALAALAAGGARRRLGGLRGLRALRGGAVFVVLVVVIFGSGAAENNATVRFPGPYTLGSEGRVQTPELIDVSRWSGARLRGAGGVLGDYYSAAYLSDLGGLDVANDIPTWDLLFYPGPVKPDTLRLLRAHHAGVLVVDRRMALGRFATGFYIDSSEPSLVGDRPIPLAALTKLEAVPWAEKVWSSSDYDVYRIVPERLP